MMKESNNLTKIESASVDEKQFWTTSRNQLEIGISSSAPGQMWKQLYILA